MQMKFFEVLAFCQNKTVGKFRHVLRGLQTDKICKRKTSPQQSDVLELVRQVSNWLRASKKNRHHQPYRRSRVRLDVLRNLRFEELILLFCFGSIYKLEVNLINHRPSIFNWNQVFHVFFGIFEFWDGDILKFSIIFRIFQFFFQ